MNRVGQIGAWRGVAAWGWALFWVSCWALFGAAFPGKATAQDPAAAAEAGAADADPAASEAPLLSEIRQLTFEGRRAGEGYFSRDGQTMVFQSEREPGNPFFQIYLMDLTTGDVQRVSPGQGKTTCAWIHPDGRQVLFASTQEDPQARKKQQQELELRASGKQRRYSWDYDEQFDLQVWNRDTGKYANLTNTRGYDAEGSWSPDGTRIVFASNRRAYAGKLSERDREQFKIDPAYMMDLYIMDADGGNVRRLTEAPGYDGGPFFSPDGKKICWRRFSVDGATAEVMTMNIDGSDKKQLTNIGAMSWAPYYHPSGEYLIFTTNKHGFANFELYLVDAAGRQAPVRVTYTDGFDGLPVFTPQGDELAWTSARTSSKRSQIFRGRWDHALARKLLKLDAEPDLLAVSAAAASAEQASPDYLKEDILRHVAFLCREELAGRLTGTEGERRATAYAAAMLDSFGLSPAGDDDGWYQSFEFTAGVDLGNDNQLSANGEPLELDRQWRPVSFSKTGAVAATDVVFAGYGIAAPAVEGQPEYDSFVHLDVKDKWVLCLRFMPEDIPAKRRQHLSRFSSLRFKTMQLRDRGARGLILVSGPRSKVRNQLIPLQFDGSLSGSSLPVISVTDAVAAKWLQAAGKQFEALQASLDSGDAAMGFALPKLQLKAEIDIQQVRRKGRNVLGWLRARDDGHPTDEALVIGAHIDHLGRGNSGSSLATENERGQIHFGADDNASGVACVLEIAQHLAHLKRQGQLPMKRDILFAAWSGEELGLIGSNHFVNHFAATAHGHGHAHPQGKAGDAKAGDAKAGQGKAGDAKAGQGKAGDVKASKTAAPAAHGAPAAPASLHPQIAACLNLDMVGRLDKNLVLQGVGSSSIWRGEIERRNVPVGLAITLQDDSYLPTDASSFYMRGVPILSAFTGSHGQYHTPRDTPDLLNYEGAVKIARLMGLIARSLTLRDKAPDYVSQAKPQDGRPRAGLRAYLGTIPDYAQGDVKGVKLSGVAKNGPAAKSGCRAGDVIVELAGRKIENIYDYTYAIEAVKIGQKTKIVVQRGEKRITLEITPGSRD